MRKIYFIIIGIALGINILFPWLVYKFFGFFYEYYPVSEKYVDKATFLITILMLMVLGMIFLSRRGAKKIDFSMIEKSSEYCGVEVEHIFWFSMFLNFYNALTIGSFSAFLNGEANGTIVAYLQLFFDARLLYFCVLLKAYKNKSIKKIIVISSIYLLQTLLYSSRAGIFWIVFFNICFMFGVKLQSSLKKRIAILLVIPVLLAPVLFVFASNNRSSNTNTVEYFAHKIVARLSYIEVAGIELEQYEDGSYMKGIFEEKYGIKNQIEQTINSLLPGEMFESDVQPNQYWRAIFSGWSESDCKENYLSMYMILPIYFIIKYGYFLGSILFIGFMCITYQLICRMKNQVFALFIGSYLMYTVVQYFDWSYHFRDLTAFILTAIVVKGYTNIRKKVRFHRRFIYNV